MTPEDSTTFLGAERGFGRGRAGVARAAGLIRRTTTPIGWGMLAAAAVGLGAGYPLGWMELVVIGWTALLVSAFSALFLLGHPRYDVSIAVSATRTRVGRPVTATITVKDVSRFRAWNTQVEVEIDGEPVALPITGKEQSQELPIPAEARGVVRVGPVRSVRGDPVGLFRRRSRFSDVEEVYVHPRTVALPPTSTGFVRDLEGQPTSDLTASDLSFHALREYRPGDDRRHISWKAAARTGELMVRQFEETRRSHLVVAFGRDEDSWEDSEEFELGVSVAASLGVRALRDGRDLTVVTGPVRNVNGHAEAREPETIPSISAGRLLDGLCDVALGDSDVSVDALATLSAATIPGISIVFLIVGSTPGIREVTSWSQRFGLGVHTVAVVCDPEATPGLREVAGVHVLRIGYLEDLPRALVRGATT
ncbi:MAG: DUF58 domain-containing protein [Galactobacter sp.]